MKELPAMLSNFSFLRETYLMGSCETKCWANLVSLDLLGPSHRLLRTTSAYCLLHWISRVQVADSSPLRWVKIWPSACLPLVFCRCQQVRHCSGQLGILSFLECQHDPLQSFRKSVMEWFRLRNTLNCFDWWYVKYERRHSGWVQLRFQSCFQIGISPPRNRVDSRFWVASRLDSFATG